MKIKILIVILFIPAMIFADYSDNLLRGGISRMKSLGNPEISLPDSTSIIDLYECGFVSSLVFRPKINYFSLSPVYENYYSIEETNYGSKYLNEFGNLSLNLKKEGENKLLFWIKEKGVFVIKPYLLWNGGKQTYNSSYYGSEVYGISKTLLAGDAEFSYLIKDGMSIGGILRYCRGNFSEIENGSTDKYTSQIDKLEYALSLSFMKENSGNKAVFAISAGPKKNVMFFPGPLSNDISFLLYGFGYGNIINLYNHYNYKSTSEYHYKSSSYYSDSKSETVIEASCFDIDIGTQITNEEKLELCFDAGLIFRGNIKKKYYSEYKSTYSPLSKYSDEEELYKNAIGYHAGLNNRFFLKAGTLGSKVELIGVAEGRDSSVYFGITEGFCAITDKLNVPVEFFIHDYCSDSIMKPEYFIYGGRVGSEIIMKNDIKLRLGTELSRHVGYEASYFFNRIDLGCGIGFEKTNFSAGLGFNYNFDFAHVGYYSNSKYENRTISISADIKMFFSDKRSIEKEVLKKQEEVVKIKETATPVPEELFGGGESGPPVEEKISANIDTTESSELVTENYVERDKIKAQVGTLKLMTRGDYEYSNMNYEDALYCYDKALKIFGESIPASYKSIILKRKAMCYKKTGDNYRMNQILRMLDKSGKTKTNKGGKKK